MESFRNDIKENVLMEGGTTYEAYYQRRPTNPDNFDPVDNVIFKAARRLDRRYFKVFGLLYHCHSPEEARLRLEQRGHQGISSASTIDRYRAYIQTRIVDIITQSPDLTKALAEAVNQK